MRTNGRRQVDPIGLLGGHHFSRGVENAALGEEPASVGVDDAKGIAKDTFCCWRNDTRYLLAE